MSVGTEWYGVLDCGVCTDKEQLSDLKQGAL